MGEKGDKGEEEETCTLRGGEGQRGGKETGGEVKKEERKAERRGETERRGGRMRRRTVKTDGGR